MYSEKGWLSTGYSDKQRNLSPVTKGKKKGFSMISAFYRRQLGDATINEF